MYILFFPTGPPQEVAGDDRHHAEERAEVDGQPQDLDSHLEHLPRNPSSHGQDAGTPSYTGHQGGGRPQHGGMHSFFPFLTRG